MSVLDADQPPAQPPGLGEITVHFDGEATVYDGVPAVAAARVNQRVTDYIL